MNERENNVFKTFDDAVKPVRLFSFFSVLLTVYTVHQTSMNSSFSSVWLLPWLLQLSLRTSSSTMALKLINLLRNMKKKMQGNTRWKASIHSVDSVAHKILNLICNCIASLSPGYFCFPSLPRWPILTCLPFATKKKVVQKQNCDRKKIEQKRSQSKASDYKLKANSKRCKANCFK